ncbi:MAG TPA: AAA family ATPase [Trebonia sp.]
MPRAVRSPRRRSARPAGRWERCSPSGRGTTRAAETSATCWRPWACQTRQGHGSRDLSGGQQRRLDLALALAGAPELLFLDEPTTGFDPAARHATWSLIKTLARDGTTIVLTTHYMEEAQTLADQVAVMTRGQIVALGPPASLAAELAALSVSSPTLEDVYLSLTTGTKP